ncbi:CobD/CbiB family cobalamin biosynthesis protein [Trinickia caryophylli]|uniref:CobD/CbiB family cobalamin biosynthesis protein n=1 Tax=Trinickia caryophylli TaxID=28094 RepID=UPI0036424D37
MASLSAVTMALLALAGFAFDALVGEPRRWHPLVGFGRWAKWLEHALNPDYAASTPPASRRCPIVWRTRVSGVAAWALAVVPPVVLSIVLMRVLPPAAGWALHAALLWFALGARSLADHIVPIEAALAAGDLPRARMLTSRVVTRDLSDAGETDVARAAVESALENGNDAIFGALFWFAIAGGPGALAFRLVNTLDAMWGYRTPRLLHFGWAAARLDDLANYVPARLTALSYALGGDWRTALYCWRTQAGAWDSPNAGPVMASGAGSLNVSCGGTARYHGADEARPALGAGSSPAAADVGRAIALVRRAIGIWFAAFALLAVSSTLF